MEAHSHLIDFCDDLAHHLEEACVDGFDEEIWKMLLMTARKNQRPISRGFETGFEILEGSTLRVVLPLIKQECPFIGSELLWNASAHSPSVHGVSCSGRDISAN